MVVAENQNFQNTPSIKPLLILPAAGFGRRAGIEGSKELLPGSQGKPLIEFHLELAGARKWPVHVITRKEKTDLIKYLNEKAQSQAIEIQYVETSREWPETILKSQDFWQEKNILSLPDTSFSPLNILDQIANSLDQVDLSVGQFEISDATDFSNWGYVQSHLSGEIEICEKPDTFQKQNLKHIQPWGVIGFKKSFGKALFDAQLASTFDHRWRQLAGEVLFLNLKEFKDATRKKIL